MKDLIKTIGILILLLNSAVLTAQQNQITRKELLNTSLDQKVGSVQMQEITMNVGQNAPKHLHPCPVLGIIKSGEAIFQIEGQEKTVLHEGDTFYEPKNKTILHFDNGSKEKALIFTAIYLKEGNEENIQFLKK
ncbi:cupin [Chryseobacterium sp. T16E-39]|uniref:cupin domain-containing protein n=1 Tax=Chryseobacterium sp. T16E-39 TaxID=2015076 RepID=UPI000B5B1720|nr:cupin domain-containing protein [Chryseobacterium sp. T16E-39]ASK29572.1 cupin [Chryseobacterium sp. T16E-39]